MSPSAQDVHSAHQSDHAAVQGLGAPACARFLTSWYADKERGTFWGFWTASNNIGGFAAPILAGTAASIYGWRWEPPSLILCACIIPRPWRDG